MPKLLTALFVLVFFSLVLKSTVMAEEWTISGNGSGSENNLNAQTQSSNTFYQNNTANINNNINANANSGGNSASGNSGNSLIVTGDSTVSINVKNQGNGNNSQIGGCCPATGTPTQTPIPSKSPTNIPGNSSTVNSNNNSTAGASAGNSSVSDPTILGLSSTSGENMGIIIVYSMGLLCLGLGGKLLLRP